VQGWRLDIGNWAGFDVTENCSTVLDQSRLHNKVNEIDNDNIHTVCIQRKWHKEALGGSEGFSVGSVPFGPGTPLF